MARRRVKGEAALYQTHTADCPAPDANGERPPHTCNGLWRGSVDLGWINGRRERRYVAATTRKAVSAKLAKLKEDVAAGVQTDATTVEQWMDYWLRHIAPRRCVPKTLATYQANVANWINPTIGRKRLAALTAADVRRLHETIRAAGRSETTVRQVHANLHRALVVAVQDQKIRVNPAGRVDAPTASGNKHAELTTPEALQLMAACRTARERARVYIAILAGLRQGEALGLDWADVHLDEQYMHIHQVAQRIKGEGVVLIERTKRGAGESRDVFMLPELTAAMRAWRDESGGRGLVFGDQARPTRPEYDWREWKLLCARARVPQVPPHGARATTATRLQELGVPIHIVAEILGHANIVVTAQRYTRARLEAQQRFLSALPAIELPAGR